ncbi:hypothetical protein NESM_000663200 [Novymonas esmeraldas]|uniref:Rab3 GTPase-activating protein catalytic subunit n=1 Tax=Novymonas esmeraldas TaxID=1808958 RepID=A0AAW0EUT4_9TRYP
MSGVMVPPESACVSGEDGGLHVCMLIFATASDAAVLRRATAAEVWSCAATRDAGEAHESKAEAGVGHTENVADTLQRTSCDEESAWTFAALPLSPPPPSTGPESLASLSVARCTAAAGELHQWRQLLGRWLTHHTVDSGALDHSAGPTHADAACTSRAVSAAGSPTAVPRTTPTTVGTETPATEHPSLLWWTRVPQGLDRGGAAEGGDGSPGSAAEAAGDRLLCIDLSGLYVAGEPKSSVQRHTRGARAAATAVGTATEPVAPPPRQRRLQHLLQERLAAAAPACPFSSARCTTASPLVLTEVWVVPLCHQSCCIDAGRDAHSAVWPLSLADFPVLPVSAPCGGGLRGYRVARHPPAHVLSSAICATEDDVTGFPTPPMQSSSACPTVSRKRRRDGVTACVPTAPLGATAVFLQSCGDGAAVEAAAARGRVSVRLRVVEGAALLHRVYFSAWCCIDDFDVTDVFLRSSPRAACSDGAVSNTASGCHIFFFAAVRRSALAEAAAVERVVEAEAVAAAAAAAVRCVRDSASILTPAAAVAEGPVVGHRGSTDALFEESALAGGGAGPQQGCPLPVWSAVELWGLWVRLGWTPPLTLSAMLVRLPRAHVSGHADTGVDDRVVRMTPSAVVEMLSRVAAELDRSYVCARRPRPTLGVVVDSAADGEGDGDGDVSDVDGAGPERPVEGEGIESAAETRREALALVRRLLEFRAALPFTAGLATPTPRGGRARPLIDQEATAPLGVAARDLAADIAATRGPGADVASFALPWLHGVLESPELLLHTTHDDGTAADAAAAALTDLLTREPPSMQEVLSRRALTSTAMSPPLWSGPLLLLPPEMDVYCEVADVAELRWAAAAWPASAAERPDHTPLDSLLPSTSCCTLACLEVRRLARATSRAEAAEEARTTRARLSSVDPLAALLYEACVDVVCRQVGDGGAAMGEVDGSRSGDAAPLSAAVNGVGGATSTAAQCRDGRLGPAEDPTPSSVAAEVVSATVAQVVQQNRPVVRRMLLLLQSYTAEASASVEVGCCRRSQNDTLAHDVWRSLAPAASSTASAGAASAAAPLSVSTCSRAAAQRLVRAFWTSVATTAQRHLRRQLPDTMRDDGESCTSDSEANREEEDQEEEEEETAAALGSVRGADADDTGSDDDAAAATRPSLSSHESCRSPALRCAFAPLPLASEPLLLHDPTTITDRPAGASAALRDAVAALDGAQAMSLYMQRVLRCTDTAAGRGRIERLSRASCPPSRLAVLASGRGATPARPLTHWLHHTLFLLSYGLASCPAAAAPRDAAPSAGAREQQGLSASLPRLEAPPSPELAAFRALRCGKLLLDVWVGTALEVYLSRWRASAAAPATP